MPRILRPSCHLIAAIAILAMLTSCSLATLACNNADTLIGYALRDYVELTSEPEIWTKARVNLLMTWHRGNELPRWHRWLTLVPMEEMRLEDRRRWQRELIGLIKARPDVPVMEAELRSWTLSPEKYRDPVYQAEKNRQREEMLGITAWQVTNATPAQKLRMQKKLSGYAEDIASLPRN